MMPPKRGFATSWKAFPMKSTRKPAHMTEIVTTTSETVCSVPSIVLKKLVTDCVPAAASAGSAATAVRRARGRIF